MTENQTNNGVSRRSFLKGAALAGVGAASMAALAGCAPQAAGSGEQQLSGTGGNGDNIEWDATYDLIVVGTGTAAFAAFYAAEQGKSVALLDKANTYGGEIRFSGGGWWVPCNTCMADAGLEDNRDDALKFMKLAGEGTQNDAACEVFVDRAPEWQQWVADSLGWVWAINDATQWGYEEGAFNEYVDYDGFRKKGRSLILGGTADDPSIAGDGAVQMQYMGEKVKSFENIDMQYNTAATELITNSDGVVMGVQVDANGKTLYYKALHGVILGTGSFDHDEEMRRAYLHTPIFNTVSTPEATGDAIKMGLKLNAKLGNMSNVWGCSIPRAIEDVPEGPALTDFSDMTNEYPRYDAWCRRGQPNCIIVNKKGYRIGNESANYHTWNRSFEGWDSGTLKPVNFPAYFIADADFFSRYPLPMMDGTAGEEVGQVAVGTSVFNTLEEVAEACGINYDNLKNTVDNWNKWCAEGKDPDFERGEHVFDYTTTCDVTGRTDLVNRNMGPVATPPFYVNAYLPGTLGTCGGLVIDEAARVINTDGEPIPHLYACGNCTAGIGGNGYGGAGYTLSLGAVMGWLGAQDALAQEPIA